MKAYKSSSSKILLYGACMAVHNHFYLTKGALDRLLKNQAAIPI